MPSLFQVVPAARFQDVVQRNGVGLTFASMGMPSFTDGPAEESKLTGVGEIRLIPDLSTKRRIPWYENAFMRIWLVLLISKCLYLPL